MAGAAVTTLPPVALGVRLVGDELAVPCLDGRQRRYVNLDAAGQQARSPRWPSVSQSSFPGTRACIAARATCRRSPPPPTSTRARRSFPSPGTPGATTWRSSAQHHRGDQPPRLSPAARSLGRRSHDCGGAPREHAALGARRQAQVRRVRPGRDLRGQGGARRARRQAETSAAGGDRGVECHGLAATARVDRRRRARARRPGGRRCRPARPPTDRYLERPTSSRSAATRCTRRSARGRSSARDPLSRRQTRSWRAAARLTS
jgi:hypothetical protein